MALRLISNPVANPKRRRRRSRRRHNPEMNTWGSGETWANPKRKRRSSSRRTSHRRSRRNPFGLEKASETVWGVSPSEIVGGVVGFIGTEILGGMLAPFLSGTADKPGLIAIPTKPDLKTVDLGYALAKTAPRAVAAALIYFVAKSLKLKGMGGKPLVDALSIGAASSTAAQFLGASHVAPEIVKDGSLVIGQRSTPPPLLIGSPAIRSPLEPSSQLVSSAGIGAVNVSAN